MIMGRVVTFLLVVIFLTGAAVFIWEVTGNNSGRAWQAFLINLLFFSAIAQSAPVLAAIYYLTEARWGMPVIRTSLGLGLFLPISLLLFVLLFAGFPYLPTGSTDSPAREAWFYPPLFFGRDIIALGILYSMSLLFLYRFFNLIQISGLKGRRLSLTVLASLVLVLYAAVFSLIGFDLVMALDRHWYSSLFGGYFFMSSFYIGLSAMTLSALLLNTSLRRREAVQRTMLWDIGKLLFAFCILTAYFLWSQFLVTWYGNLPEEVGFFVLRMKNDAWAQLTWVALALIFVVPFVVLLGQRAKQSKFILLAVVTLVLVGMWLERYLLIAPSLAVTKTVSLGWTEAAITATFLATMILTYSVYLTYFSPRCFTSENLEQ